MDRGSFAERRAVLVESIEKDRKEVRVALRELTGAAEQTFDVRERIRASPMPWALGALLVGIWLGARPSVVQVTTQRRSR